MNKIFLFVLVIALINILVFFTTSEAVFALSAPSLNPINLLAFQFSHFDLLHLLENLLGFVFTAALAIELEMKTKDFLLAYFVGIFIAVPLLFLFPGGSIAGNSTGIFGALAATLFKARRFIPMYISYPLATLFIFSVTLSSYFSGAFHSTFFKTDIFHFFGFVSGALSLKWKHRRVSILK